MKKISIFVFLSLFVFAAGAFAQQPRVAEKPSASDPEAPKPSPAPDSFEAKYEGGIYGYSKKEDGMLKFDDANERLVFFGKDKKEKLSVPYKSMLVIYPQSQSVQSTTGQVVSMIPYGGIFGEHLARVAESTIRSVMRPALPVLPQRRAAGA